MADHDATDRGDTQRTAELTIREPRNRLPARDDDFRDQLPGLEPERQVTDWGRSERVEQLVDRTLYSFLYHYWFRVEVEGIENVPSDGAALLVANHSGVLPSDGAMIAKAMAEDHPRGRPVHLAADGRLSGLPGLGMLFTKLGAVGAHPANLHRLLFDECQLVLVFPEGEQAGRKPIKDRYRLGRFHDQTFAQAAVRAGAPIVPVAVLGAEEALPVFASVKGFRGLPSVPLTALVPLPAKFRLRFLEPIGTDKLGERARADQGTAQVLVEEIRALIQENLLEMVAARRSVWLG